MPHGDMWSYMNYNRPKVSKDGSSRARSSLPLPSVTTVSAAGYMLENPVYPSGTRRH